VQFLPNGDISIDDEVFTADIKEGVNSIYKVDVNNQKFTIEVTNDDFIIDGEKTEFSVKPFIPISTTKTAATSKREIKISAPIPGKITKIFVDVGTKVFKDQELLILEAMKMRNRIFSPLDGEIKKILVQENENVEQDQKLIVIKPS
jgi:pyruvate carboxylase subunit B